MPITIEYQPSLVAAGQLAYDAGRGQYLQERDRFGLASAQLGEQARQFDQRLQFAAQESRLRDSQFRDQLGQQAWQFGAQHQQRQQGMYADLMRQQMVQEGYAQHAQTQYDIAVMQQDARAAEQQMVMGRQQALTEQQALQRYIQDNRGVLSPQQVADLQAQFEQRHGMPMGFDASAAIEAQRAVEETAMKRRASALSQMYGVPPEAAEEMLFVNPETGAVELTNYGQETIRHRQKEMDNQRMLDIAEQNAQLQREEFAMREREMGMKSQVDTQAAQGKQQQAQEKLFADVDTKGRKAFADTQSAWDEWNAYQSLSRGRQMMEGQPPAKPSMETIGMPRLSPDQVTPTLPAYTMFRTNFNGRDIVVIQLPNGKQAVWDGQTSPSELVRIEMAKGAK